MLKPGQSWNDKKTEDTSTGSFQPTNLIEQVGAGSKAQKSTTPALPVPVEDVAARPEQIADAREKIKKIRAEIMASANDKSTVTKADEKWSVHRTDDMQDKDDVWNNGTRYEHDSDHSDEHSASTRARSLYDSGARDVKVKGPDGNESLVWAKPPSEWANKIKKSEEEVSLPKIGETVEHVNYGKGTLKGFNPKTKEVTASFKREHETFEGSFHIKHLKSSSIKKSDDKDPCPECGDSETPGQIFNNNDPKSGQSIECETCKGKGEVMKKAEKGCHKCGDMHKTSKCMKGKSYKDMKKQELDKARIDEGKDLETKVRSRQERNDREIIETKTPSGQSTRTGKSSYRRKKELEVGDRAVYSKPDAEGRPMNVRGIPAERRKGEKISGTPKEQDESSAGVHIRQATYSPKEQSKAGDGATGAMSEKGGSKSWRSGGKYHAGGKYGATAAHKDVMDAQSKIKPQLSKGETFNQLQKAEQQPEEHGVVPHSELAMHTKIAGKKITKYNIENPHIAEVWVDGNHSPVSGTHGEVLSPEIKERHGLNKSMANATFKPGMSYADLRKAEVEASVADKAKQADLQKLSEKTDKLAKSAKSAITKIKSGDQK